MSQEDFQEIINISKEIGETKYLIHCDELEGLNPWGYKIYLIELEDKLYSILRKNNIQFKLHL